MIHNPFQRVSVSNSSTFLYHWIFNSYYSAIRSIPDYAFQPMRVETPGRPRRKMARTLNEQRYNSSSPCFSVLFIVLSSLYIIPLLTPQRKNIDHFSACIEEQFWPGKKIVMQYTMTLTYSVSKHLCITIF